MEINRYVIIALLFDVAFVLGGQVSFEDCGGTYELEEVEIDGCDKTSICMLSIKDIVNISALITASSQPSTSLSHAASLMLNSIQTWLPVSPDACVASPCPIYSQAQTRYSARFTMPNTIALNTRGYLEWKIWNNMNSMIVCFRVNVETTNRYYFFERLLKTNPELLIK